MVESDTHTRLRSMHTLRALNNGADHRAPGSGIVNN